MIILRWTAYDRMMHEGSTEIWKGDVLGSIKYTNRICFAGSKQTRWRLEAKTSVLVEFHTSLSGILIQGGDFSHLLTLSVSPPTLKYDCVNPTHMSNSAHMSNFWTSNLSLNDCRNLLPARSTCLEFCHQNKFSDKIFMPIFTMESISRTCLYQISTLV